MSVVMSAVMSVLQLTERQKNILNRLIEAGQMNVLENVLEDVLETSACNAFQS